MKKLWTPMERTFFWFHGPRCMKELLLCISAFSISMMIADNQLFIKQTDPILKEKYQMIECDSLYENNYSVDIDGQKFRAAGECFFGGYYPSGPVSEL